MSVIALGVALRCTLPAKTRPQRSWWFRSLRCDAATGAVLHSAGLLCHCGTGNAVNLTDGLDGLAIMPTVLSPVVLRWWRGRPAT